MRHDVITQPVLGARIEQRQDIGVLQLGGDLDFTKESLRRERGRDFGLQQLDGHVPAMPQVLGEEDRRHGSAPELPLDGIAALEHRLESCDQRIVQEISRS